MKKCIIFIILFLLLCIFCQSDSVISYLCPVSASKTHPSTLTTNICDNDLKTSWNSGCTIKDFGDPISITIDLGSPSEISSISLFPEMEDYRKNVLIKVNIILGYVNGNFTNWKNEGFIIDNNAFKNKELIYSFKNKKFNVRYVKISIVEYSLWAAWNEIKIFGSKKAIINIAYNKIARASNTHINSNTLNVLDGDILTSWNSNKKSSWFNQEWIEVDLLSQSEVTGIDLISNQSGDGLANIIIKFGFSTDGSIHNIEWKTIFDLNRNIYDKQLISLKLEISEFNVRFIQVITISSPSEVAWREIKVYGRDQSISQSDIKYFGYFGGLVPMIGGKSPDDLVRSSTLNLLGIATHGNLFYIQPEYPEDAIKVIEWIKKNKPNFKVFLNISNMKFYTKENYTNVEMIGKDSKPDLYKYLKEFDPKLGFHNIDFVYAFSPSDEPNLNSNKIFENAEELRNEVTEQFPQTRYAVILSYERVMDIDPIRLKGYDVIGFDYYIQSGAINFEQYLVKFNKLKSILDSSKKIIIVGDAAFETFRRNGTVFNKIIRNRELLHLSQMDPQIECFMPFLYYNTNDGSNIKGVESYPVLEAEMFRIADKILNN